MRDRRSDWFWGGIALEAGALAGLILAAWTWTR